MKLSGQVQLIAAIIYYFEFFKQINFMGHCFDWKLISSEQKRQHYWPKFRFFVVVAAAAVIRSILAIWFAYKSLALDEMMFFPYL